jgi:hypothetical protein
MNPNETHLNRYVGNNWWYWPAVIASSTTVIMASIYLMSISGTGASVGLMLRKLI